MKLFFDVDGVLIDGWHANPDLRRPWDIDIEADLGMDRDGFRDLFFGAPGARSAAPMFACVTGRRDLLEALAEVLPRAGYKGDTVAFARYWFEKDSVLNDDVFALVDDIRRNTTAKLYLATGQEHHRAHYLWETLGFSQRFDGIFYSAAIGHPKKDIRFFAAINRTLAIDTDERPLFFDDQPEIAALAQTAGWDGVAFTSANDIRHHPRLAHLWR